MRPSRKTSYGWRALFDLAFHSAGGAAQAREIAARQGIPLRYLEQILRDLRRAGMVDAKRGPGGGYALACPARDLRLSRVFEVLDGAPSRPKRSGTTRPAPDVDVPEFFFRDVSTRFAAMCDGVTVQDMVDRAALLGLAQAPTTSMYFI